jgi:hypothetical protein
LAWASVLFLVGFIVTVWAWQALGWHLVERIATEVPGDWDDSLVNTDYRI